MRISDWSSDVCSSDLPVASIADLGLAETSNFNAYFPGYGIAMAQPIYEDSVASADGTPATVDQMSRDVSHLLMWAAEPKLEARKHNGLKDTVSASFRDRASQCGVISVVALFFTTTKYTSTRPSHFT